MNFGEGVVLFAQLTLLLYALGVAGGGIFAFYKFQSKWSLWSGLALGAYLIIAFIITWIFTTIGFILAIIGVVILLTFFGLRYYSTEKFMPGGLMAIISIIVVIIMIIGLIVGFF